ncbi:DUF7146 domain-containing protein [Arvimicrobium flavum]|uniref:DUF7146 domain-containing protein n=1 Tax=Arvimicrobium flavum TaxID=3393320 RepID=UPI00237C1B5C|nr:toprim domain-containing protein [Mesorhizobium shangrilense]
MTPPHAIHDLSRSLARNAEAVCRHYLSSGSKHGRYWLVGDTANNPGRSLYVRLAGPDSGKGAAGKWTDAAQGSHGDLLDLIRESCGLKTVHDAADEARRFLSLPRPDPLPARPAAAVGKQRSDAFRRLWAMSGTLSGTHAEAYLRARCLTHLTGTTASLRFHPGCYYRGDDGARATFPALIAAVTDERMALKGLHRTWLDPRHPAKAHVEHPRRAMGALLGHGVRFGFDHPADVMTAGEGIETMLSLRQIMPLMPMIAALSAAHLGALVLPPGVKRLYIAEDADGAGRRGVERLHARACNDGIETMRLKPALGDFNDDLRRAGLADLTLRICAQLTAADAARFVPR